MSNFNAKVDEYIANSEDFAKPILIYYRDIIHQAIPEIQETIKWRFPHFEYKGILCNIGGYKNHSTFTFWKGSLINDKYKQLQNIGEKSGMASFGKHKSIDDLPDEKIIIEYLMEAKRLNEEGIKVPSPPKIQKPPLITPIDFKEKLKLNPIAKENYKNLSPSHKREYIHWIEDAKKQTTRQRRMSKAVIMLEENRSSVF